VVSAFRLLDVVRICDLLKNFADTEIDQFGVVILAKYDVLRLYVPMQHAIFVTVLKSGGGLFEYGLDRDLGYHSVLVDTLRLMISTKSVCCRIPIQQLAARAIFHDHDQFVFKSCLIINNL
jgi:hypothetical protein